MSKKATFLTTVQLNEVLTVNSNFVRLGDYLTVETETSELKDIEQWYKAQMIKDLISQGANSIIANMLPLEALEIETAKGFHIVKDGLKSIKILEALKAASFKEGNIEEIHAVLFKEFLESYITIEIGGLNFPLNNKALFETIKGLDSNSYTVTMHKETKGMLAAASNKDRVIEALKESRLKVNNSLSQCVRDKRINFADKVYSLK